MAEHKFTKKDLVLILNAAKHKTLGELDVNNVFAKTEGNPKITGIAGDVIEQSVLGYPPDRDQKPDLIVDGVPTEEKTTGMVKNKDGSFKAKEPCSITAVSPMALIKEEFHNSSFWHKAAHILFVYYHYNKKPPVPSWEYKDFTVEGYDFFEFNDTDKEALRKDWQIVHDYVTDLREKYPNDNDFKAQIPKMSSNLRDKLFMMDLVPRKNPRFRLKQSVMASIVHNSFSKPLEQLAESYTSFDDVDVKCREITSEYKGWTIEQIVEHFNISSKIDGKSIGEKIILNMFGGTAAKLNKIELFSKYGINGKSITLTSQGKRTEDMKLFHIDFDEIYNEELTFEESEFFSYFYEQQMLLIVFEESSQQAPLKDNVFIGFKRLSFDDDFIFNEVQGVWNQIRKLVLNKELRDIIRVDKDGQPVINKKSGVVSSAPNFPKSKDNRVFVRGSAIDATDKTEVVNGIRMYAQYAWVKGSYIAERLESVEFIE